MATGTAVPDLGGALLSSLSAAPSHHTGLAIMQHPQYSAHLSSMALSPTVVATPATTISALLQSVPYRQHPHITAPPMPSNSSYSHRDAMHCFFSQQEAGVATSLILPSVLESELRQSLIPLLQGPASVNLRMQHSSQVQDRSAASLLSYPRQMDPRFLALSVPPPGSGMGVTLSRGEYCAVSRFPTSSRSKLLGQSGDVAKLSPQQVFLRQQIEVFAANEEEASTHTRGRNKPISNRQVGIRCRHCCHLSISRRQKGATYFPASIQGIYQAAQNMSTTHLQCGLCSEMPDVIKNEFARLLATKVARAGAGRAYWAESAKKLGLVDTDAGIRFVTSNS